MKASTKKVLGIIGGILGAVGLGYGLTKLITAKKATCSGTVRDATTGEPLSEVLITLNSLQTLTDLNGSYMFEDVTAGKHTLAFSKEGFKEVSMAIVLKEGANRFDVNLVPLAVPEASVVFTVIDANTSIPLQGVLINLAGTTRTTDNSGRCQFTGITPGDYSIGFQKAGYETYSDTVSFHPVYPI